MMNRFALRFSVPVLAGLVVLIFQQAAWANHNPPCRLVAVRDSEVANLFNNDNYYPGLNKEPPTWIEQAVQGCKDDYNGPYTIGAMWVENTSGGYTFSVPAGSRASGYMFAGAVVLGDAPYTTAGNVNERVLSTTAYHPDGSSAGSPVIFPGGTDFFIDDVHRGRSRAVSMAIEIDTSRLEPGVNQICASFRQSAVYGSTTRSDDGGFCFDVTYNPTSIVPPPAPADPYIQILDSGQPVGSQVFPGDTLYFEVVYGNGGAGELPGPVYPEGFNFPNGGSPDTNSSIPAGGAWETNPNISCADVNSGGTAHGSINHAYWCAGSTPAGAVRGNMYFRVDVSLTAIIGTNICVHADLNMGAIGRGSIHSTELCHRVARPDFNVHAELSPGAGLPAPGGEITPGNYTVNASAVNDGPGESDEIVLEVPQASGMGNAGQSNVNFNSSTGYNNGCGSVVTPSCSRDHWYWINSSGIAGGTSRSGTFTFNVPSNTLDGTQVCYQASAYHVNLSRIPQYDLSDQLCWRVLNPRYPYITTNDGDVHAGGGIGVGLSCGTSGGQIKGRRSGGAGTEADYVVSAGASIDNLSIAAPVLLGPSGSYGRICRPDLQQSADRFPNDPVNGKFRTTWLGAFVGQPVGQVLASSPSAATVTVPGGVIAPGQRLTIYATGDVYITGDITYSPVTTAPGSLPSFGIIAKGNIFIAPSVTKLDGFFYAYENIDTCFGGVIGPGGTAGGNNPVIGPCSQNLVVNGFMMAEQFRFARTGAGRNYGLTPSPTETVNFKGELYVATPPGFIDNFTIRAIRPSIESERPPLY